MALVDVLSLSDEKIRDHVTAGMLSACEQFNVPIVGGHLHPDTPYSVIDVAILGIARLDSVIYSHTAGSGDAVIAAIDLNGRVHPSCILNWDSVTMKSPARVRAQIRMLQTLGEAHLVTAGKDISNPGIIGTLGMLLEMSEKGAVIELEKIPRPDLKAHGISFEHWVRMYPGMGFVLTAKPRDVKEVCRRFASVGMTACSIGRVDGDRNLCIEYGGEQASVFDLKKESVMGIITNPCELVL
jgi:selenophosphate synthetase-related protein